MVTVSCTCPRPPKRDADKSIIDINCPVHGAALREIRKQAKRRPDGRLA